MSSRGTKRSRLFPLSQRATLMSSRAQPCFVIARNVAISPFPPVSASHPLVIASAAWRSRIHLSSRGTWRSLLSIFSSRAQPYFVIARNVAISVFYLVLSSAAWRSRFFAQDKTEEERLLRRLAMTKRLRKLATPQRGKSPIGCFDKTALQARIFMSSRAQRGDLGFLRRTKQKRRDCFAGSHFHVIASAALLCHRERSVAISVVAAGKEKREIASCLAMTDGRDCFVPRNDRIDLQ